MATKKSINIAIIGYGYWGPNLVRNFRNSSQFRLRYLVEKNRDIVSDFKLLNPEVKVVYDLQEMLSDDTIECVAVATPPQTHFQIAKACLEAGKHILIEKPFTTCFEDAKTLVELAAKQNLEILVDFTFLYNGAVKALKNTISNTSRFGDLLYIDSVRINLGIFQSNVNVVMDLACHDISIFNYLLEELPTSIHAIGIDGLNNGIENISYIYLKYQNKFAHVNCSWSSPVKIRNMLIGGTKQAVLYNDIEPTDKLKIYDKGVVFSQNDQRNDLLQDYRTGEVHIPKYDTTEALKNVVDEYYEVIVNKKESKSSGKAALLVMFILEMIQKSIHLNGKEIDINWKQVGPSLYSYITSKGMLKEQFEASKK